MQEIEMENKKQSLKTRRSVSWLMNDLDMAIERELVGFMEKYTVLKESKSIFSPLYRSAARLMPAYDLLKIKKPEVAAAIKDILAVKG